MNEIRLEIPNDVVKKFQEQLGGNIELKNIVRDALTLFNWAVQEKAKGRLILSSNQDGKEMTQFVMDSLEHVVLSK